MALSAGCGIDVNRRPLGPNQFLVEAQGRDYDSLADVVEAAHHEAASACGGSYRVIDDASSRRQHSRYDEITTKSVEVVLTIQCGAAQGGEPPIVHAERK